MRASANVQSPAIDLSQKTSGSQRIGPKRAAPRIDSHTLSRTPAPAVDPDYGCVEWFIYEERRMRRDGT